MRRGHGGGDERLRCCLLHLRPPPDRAASSCGGGHGRAGGLRRSDAAAAAGVLGLACGCAGALPGPPWPLPQPPRRTNRRYNTGGLLGLGLGLGLAAQRKRRALPPPPAPAPPSVELDLRSVGGPAEDRRLLQLAFDALAAQSAPAHSGFRVTAMVVYTDQVIRPCDLRTSHAIRCSFDYLTTHSRSPGLPGRAAEGGGWPQRRGGPASPRRGDLRRAGGDAAGAWDGRLCPAAAAGEGRHRQ